LCSIRATFARSSLVDRIKPKILPDEEFGEFQGDKFHLEAENMNILALNKIVYENNLQT
jgi:hypothetical protein